MVITYLLDGIETPLEKLPLRIIAKIILNDWGYSKVYFGAKPYLEAMFQLDTVDDKYIMDSGKSIVAYFLSNAGTWKGDTAREVKKHLKKLIK